MTLSHAVFAFFEDLPVGGVVEVDGGVGTTCDWVGAVLVFRDSAIQGVVGVGRGRGGAFAVRIDGHEHAPGVVAVGLAVGVVGELAVVGVGDEGLFGFECGVVDNSMLGVMFAELGHADAVERGLG